MRLAKLVGRIGRVLITAGVLILSFVAYQLWGTGLQASAAQDDAQDQFEAAQDEFETTGTLPGGDEGSTTTTTGGGATTTTAAPSATTTTTAAGNGSGNNGGGSREIPPPPPEGELMGRIQIPSIDVDWYFYEGIDLSILKDGPGHYMGTPMPGQPGNSAIAGHRTTYGAPFNRVDEIKSGDEIIITYVTGAEFTYVYRTTEIVSPDRVDILENRDADNDGQTDNMLTLIACHPEYSAAQRIIIFARLDEEPVPPPADQERQPIEFTDIDGGSDDTEPVSRTPAILWGVAAGMIWLAAYFVGRAWRKWPAYILGFPFFAVALFIFFENFYALLPAGF